MSEIEIREVVELAEMAWESSMSELAAFGCIEFEEGVPWNQWRGEEREEAAYAAYRDDEEPVCYGLM